MPLLLPLLLFVFRCHPERSERTPVFAFASALAPAPALALVLALALALVLALALALALEIGPGFIPDLSQPTQRFGASAPGDVLSLLDYSRSSRTPPWPLTESYFKKIIKARRSGPLFIHPGKQLEPDTELHRDISSAVAVGWEIVRHRKVRGRDSVDRNTRTIRVIDEHIASLRVEALVREA